MPGWPRAREELIEEQLLLATLVPEPWLFEPSARVGGVFVCFPRGPSGAGQAGDRAWAAACVGEKTVVVTSYAGAAYEPGLLALREGELLEAAVRALTQPLDVLVVDATGRDHLPTVGVTHRPLGAEGKWPEDERGARSPLMLEGDLVGQWMCTRVGTRQLAVHAAWRTDPATASEAVLSTCRARTPEPIRQARRRAREARARDCGTQF